MDINTLQTITNFAADKGLTRQHVYRLFDSKELTEVKVDGVSFVLLDDAAKNYQRKRKRKGSN